MSEEPPSLLEVGPACVGVAGLDGRAVHSVVLVMGILGVLHVAYADLERFSKALFQVSNNVLARTYA